MYLYNRDCNKERTVDDKEELVRWARAWLALPRAEWLGLDADEGDLRRYADHLYVFTEIAGWVSILVCPPDSVLNELIDEDARQGQERE